MTRTRIRTFAPLLLLAVAACGSIPAREFEFDAIDVGEKPLTCLVVVNDDWVGAAEKKQFVNLDGHSPLVMKIEFPSSEVEVTMAPVGTEGGKVTRVPKSRSEARDYSGFQDESRRLRLGFPRRMLFILPRATRS